MSEPMECDRVISSKLELQCFGKWQSIVVSLVWQYLVQQ